MSARVMGADAARAVGRFRPEGVEGYRAATAPNAPLRATRAEAVEDERAHLDRPTPPYGITHAGPAYVIGHTSAAPSLAGHLDVTYWLDGQHVGTVTYADADTAIETANAWHSLMQDPHAIGWNTAS